MFTQPLDRVGVGGEHLLAPQPDALDQPVHERVGAAVLEGARRRAVEPEERLRPVAALGRELRALERGRDRRATMSSLRRRASWVSRAMSTERSSTGGRDERAHHRAGVGRVGQQRAARRARRAPRRAGSRRRRRSAGRDRALLQRRGDHGGPRASPSARARRSRCGGTPSRDRAARPRPPRPAPARARCGSARTRTRPAAGSASAPSSMRSAIGATTAAGGVEDAPARAVVALQLHDLRASGNSRWKSSRFFARRARGSGRSPGRRRPPP